MDLDEDKDKKETRFKQNLSETNDYKKQRIKLRSSSCIDKQSSENIRREIKLIQNQKA